MKPIIKPSDNMANVEESIFFNIDVPVNDIMTTTPNIPRKVSNAVVLSIAKLSGINYIRSKGKK